MAMIYKTIIKLLRRRKLKKMRKKKKKVNTVRKDMN